MARYSVNNELQSIDFHDSFLEKLCIENDALHMVFSDAIIIGHSCPELPNRIPCSVNTGEDRYACPQLDVILKGFHIHSILQGGCWAKDTEGNTIEKYPPRNLLPEEYNAFFQMVPGQNNNHVYGISYDAQAKIYTLSLFMTADANYYEIEFSAESAIAEFDDFGKEAWYLERYWKERQGQ